jgi:hypothetical protein
VKKLLSLLVSVAFLTGMVGIAAAQTSTTTTPEKKAGEKMEKAGDKAEKKAEKKMASKNASGTVKSAAADSVVVAGKEKGKAAEWTFAVDPKTKIKKAGKDITAADLKAGDSVQVKYMEMEGKAVAQSISVKGGGMAKKAENPCSTKPGAKNPCAAKPAEKK